MVLPILPLPERRKEPVVVSVGIVDVDGRRDGGGGQEESHRGDEDGGRAAAAEAAAAAAAGAAATPLAHECEDSNVAGEGQEGKKNKNGAFSGPAALATTALLSSSSSFPLEWWALSLV